METNTHAKTAESRKGTILTAATPAKGDRVTGTHMFGGSFAVKFLRLFLESFAFIAILALFVYILSGFFSS